MTIDYITITVKCTINTAEVLNQVQNTMHIQSTATMWLKQLAVHNAYHRFERRVNRINLLSDAYKCSFYIQLFQI